MVEINHFDKIILSIGVFVMIVFVSNPAYATPTIQFDYPWYFTGHGAIITINDQTKNGVGSVTLDLSSSPSQHTLSGIAAIETPSNSGIFVTPWINFTTGTPINTKTLQVAIGDTVTAKYPSTANPQATASVPIYDSNNYGTLPTTIPLTFAQKTVKFACNGVAYPTWLTNGMDSDGDAICDSWETSTPNQLAIPNGAVTYRYFCGTTPTDTTQPLGTQANPDPVCPRTDTKDVFVEVESLKGHKMTQKVMDDLRTAFANTHVPSGTITKYALHIQNKTELNYHRDNIDPPSSTYSSGTPPAGSFDAIKNVEFGLPSERSDPNAALLLQAKRQVFHYALLAHFYTTNPHSSGISETPGNDMMISLGSFTNAVGSVDQQEGTFMHELGHNLGLNHGGPVKIGTTTTPDNGVNCKPNYLSVMSYARQFSDYVSNRVLNYSGDANSILDETSTGGIIESNGEWSSYRNPQTIVYGFATTGTSSYGTGSTYTTNPPTGIDFDQNTNHIIDTTPQSMIVHSLPVCIDTTKWILNGYNDWANLKFDVRGASSFYDGRSSGPSSDPGKDNVVTPKNPEGDYQLTDNEIELKHVKIMRQGHLHKVLKSLGFSGATTTAYSETGPKTILIANENIYEKPRENVTLAQSEIDQLSSDIDNGDLDNVIQKLQDVGKNLPSGLPHDEIGELITSFEKGNEPAHKTRDSHPPLYPTPLKQQNVHQFKATQVLCNGNDSLLINKRGEANCIKSGNVDQLVNLGWTKP